MAGPQTAREALIAELIGDVDALIERAEILQKSIPAAADEAVHGIMASGERVVGQLNEATQLLRADLARERAAALQPLQLASKAATDAAAAVTDGARRLATLALLTGRAGGALAGALVGAAVAVLVR